MDVGLVAHCGHHGYHLVRTLAERRRVVANDHDADDPNVLVASSGPLAIAVGLASQLRPRQNGSSLLIRERRLKAGLTQANLAEGCSVTAQTISLWERGLRQPRANQRAYLARLLGGSPSDYDVDVDAGHSP